MYVNFIDEIKTVQDNSMSSNRLDDILKKNAYDVDIMENFQIFKNQRNNSLSLVLDSNPVNARRKALIYQSFIDNPNKMTPEMASTIYTYIIKYRAKKCFEILCRYKDEYLPLVTTCIKYSYEKGVRHLLANVDLFSVDYVNGNEFFSSKKENLNDLYMKDEFFLLPFAETLKSSRKNQIITKFRNKINFDEIRNVINNIITRQTSYISFTLAMKKRLLYLLNLGVNVKLLTDAEIFDEIFYDTIYSYYLSNTNNRTLLIKKISQI